MSIVKNGFISVVQIIVATASSILIFSLIGSRLGKAQIGVWATIATYPAVIGMVGSGVSGCLIRFLPAHLNKENFREINLLIVNALLFNTVIAVIFALAGYFFSDEFLRFLFDIATVPPLYTTVFRMSLVLFVITFISSALTFSLDGLQQIYMRNIIMMSASIVFCLASIVLILRYGLPGLLWAQIIQALLVLVLSVLLLIRLRIFRYSEMHVSKTHLRLFLSYGRNFQLISFSILLFDPLTKVFLNHFYNLSAVGIYEMVSRVIAQGRQLIVSAIKVIEPVISGRVEHDDPYILELYGKAARGGVLIGASAYTSLIVVAGPAILLFDPSDMPVYVAFILLLSFAYLCNIVSTPAYSVFLGRGLLQPLVISHVSSTGINLVLFLFFRDMLPDWLMILPPTVATSLSSLYVIYRFHRSYDKAAIPRPAEDFRIYLFSGLAIAVSMLTLVYRQPWSGFVLAAAYLLILSYLAFRNSFLHSVFQRVWTPGQLPAVES